MADGSRILGTANAASVSDAGPWPVALAVLAVSLRRGLGWILLAAVVFGGLGFFAKSSLPPRYTATAQFLLDPRGLPVFPGDVSTAQFDANSQIGVVESQMRILTSERVLSKVLRDESLMNDLAPDEDVEAKNATPTEPMPLRPSLDSAGGNAAALAALQRSIQVTRAERSFVIDVAATAATPAAAANLANAVVEAYVEADAANRTATARRLADELTSRLNTLRQQLSDAEAKANAFRMQNGLISTGDRLVVEQKLADAVTEVGAAQLRLDQATSRAAQLDSSRQDVGMLGANDDTRSLTLLIERQNAAQEDLVALAARLGDRHPDLTAARGRVAEIGRRIDLELARIRLAARADLERARTTQQAVARSVATLSDAVAKAQQAKIEMRALEQEVETHRTLLESFKTRALQAGEFGRIDPGAVRIVSVAQPPPARKSLAGQLAWSVLGAAFGGILAMALLTLRAMLTFGSLSRLEPRRHASARPMASSGEIPMPT
ncbi:GumC family protein [Kaistia terrae]|uniref:GumC family protein n=1 Tax=Kaistia terrae TaxID=537017 RepID=A0ABW0PS20_9HYPH|nr:GumC family protein [Kaistia terrae]MCX5577650.1 GumC family protein [Kaistia terrae]